VVFARKRFGQHFLHDRAVLERILEAIDPQPGQALVEIGPGRGALTEPLRTRCGALDIIEIDRDLVAALRERYRDAPVTVHEGDALKFDFAALSTARGSRLRIVGNLPYNISTPLLFHLLSTPAAISDLHVMLQKEVIERICAAPGGRDYGRLTVMLAPWVETDYLFDVGPGAFQPPPKVWSAVARLTVRATPRFTADARLATVVSLAFAQRRKTLRNALKTVLSAEQIAACGIDPSARPETVSPENYGKLAELLQSR
jgi:16S rRNA (adenine1518-N6/adenine1519-N6)-dimethyltransferase